jgi:hypothetical protein
MKDDVETDLRLLEQATAAHNEPAERLDPETASLREAWLAFGEMLEARQPADSVSPLLPGEGPGVRAASLRRRRRWQRLLAAGVLAASLLVAMATIWMLSNTNDRDKPAITPTQMAGTKDPVAPSQKAQPKTVAAADTPQWDDSFDEKLEQVRWQMLCVQENQTFRTDAFGQAQYRLEQLSETIQADSL